MNITNYLRVCNKTLWILAGVYFLSSCKDSSSEKEINKFLGTPKEAQINLRFIPSEWISKQLFDSLPNDPNGAENALISSFIEDSPSLIAVSKNFLSLEPDLSKNWIVSSGVLGESKYVSFYFNTAKGEKIKDWLLKENIASENIYQGVKCLEVDKKSTHRDFILYDEAHVLWLKVYGKEEDNKTILDQCLYLSKDAYISFFESLFTNHRNDLDIYLKSDEKLSQYISEPLAKDVLEKFDGFISFNLKENQISLEIENNSKEFVLDSVFQNFTPIEEKVASFQANLNFTKLKNVLLKYNYLDDINHELKKAKLDFNQLEEFGLSEILLNYNGLKTKQSKSISYEFDEDFNEKEKITYTKTESHDFEGLIYTKGIKNLITTCLTNNFLSKTDYNSYEPIFGSNSVIKLDTNKLKIGEITRVPNSKMKLIFAINDPEKILELANKQNLLNLFPIKNARVELNNSNKIRIEINTFGEPFGYAKSVKQIMDPKTFGN